AVLVVSALFGTMQGAHPGPLNKTSTAVGSIQAPVNVNVNCCPVNGDAGDVTNPVSAGFDPPTVGVPKTAISQSPRPCVPAPRTPRVVFNSIWKTCALGNPK